MNGFECVVISGLALNMAIGLAILYIIEGRKP